MQIHPHYVTYTIFNGIGWHSGLGHACDPTDFDGACDAYAEARKDGQEAMVFRIEPPAGDKAGAMIDVTDDAEHRIAQRYMQRGDDLPAWMLWEFAE